MTRAAQKVTPQTEIADVPLEVRVEEMVGRLQSAIDQAERSRASGRR